VVVPPPTSMLAMLSVPSAGRPRGLLVIWKKRRASPPKLRATSV